ncbi:hypothetical protein AGMMS49953_06890 [Endomicrobiia bacterium]|uniref:hypothetical protein n=1 Tax=Endomicrobium trichonymphae TaxID=1408204 RepID=UPI000BBA6E06|nr:hypothetical protein [Candidatus Endomicrobium trichonymphae]GHT24428.1 hypothetical protein AGMMS49953_06890 [Endomicrobiia bacterium]
MDLNFDKAVLKDFKKENLAILHPLGTIGKKLIMRVSDLMRKGKQNPVVKQTATVKDALLVCMTGTRESRQQVLLTTRAKL